VEDIIENIKVLINDIKDLKMTDIEDVMTAIDNLKSDAESILSDIECLDDGK